MPAGYNVELHGLIETQDFLADFAEQLTGTMMLQAIRDCALIVLASAKQKAPVDTGRLRASITPEVRPHRDAVRGIVGSNVEYAPWQEFGTRPHWPPPGALERWARRHGMTESTIRFIIGTRGTKPHPYLIPAIEDNARKIYDIISTAIRWQIERG
jgi:HK97 gp10 family phage protein